MFIPVILAGGSGTRLWPLSRQLYPKQLLPLCGDKTMLQNTARRASEATGEKNGRPIVVCNEEHRFLIAEQLREIGVEPQSILLEPTGRNTAPALTVAALAASKADPQAILFVTPADHVIDDEDAFSDAARKGAELAKEKAIVTFGIVPTGPETGYGYIRIRITDAGTENSKDATALEIAEFVEKPDAMMAERYLQTGAYLWNSGMFMLRADVWLELVGRFQPDMLKACEDAYRDGEDDRDFYRLARKAFETCPNDSIDYAVMEPLCKDTNGKSAVVVPLDCGWSDVGAWGALWDIQSKDTEGNVLRGDVYVRGTRNSLVYAEDRLVAMIGIEDAVVVETSDAVLVASKAQEQAVKDVVQWLKSEDREEHLNHTRIYRPWGSYECIDVGERYKVKRIVVNAGASLSLQMHHHRAEHWIVVKGTASVTCGDETFLVSENQSTYIPIGSVHRLQNPGSIPLEMIEVQSGSYLGEDDIVRLDDEYGRAEGRI